MNDLMNLTWSEDGNGVKLRRWKKGVRNARRRAAYLESQNPKPLPERKRRGQSKLAGPFLGPRKRLKIARDTARPLIDPLPLAPLMRSRTRRLTLPGGLMSGPAI